MASPRSDDQILVAEDNPLLAELLVDQLSLGGWRVVCAGDGAEALAMIEQLRPSLLVLDIGLPKLDGFAVMAELAARRRADPANAPDMPIIVMSGYGAIEDRDRAFALACRAWPGACPGPVRQGRSRSRRYRG